LPSVARFFQCVAPATATAKAPWPCLQDAAPVIRACRQRAWIEPVLHGSLFSSLGCAGGAFNFSQRSLATSGCWWDASGRATVFAKDMRGERTFSARTAGNPEISIRCLPSSHTITPNSFD